MQISPFVGTDEEAKMLALDAVSVARARRDHARDLIRESSDEFSEAIVAAVLAGCSMREIADRAGISFQRVSVIAQEYRDVNDG